MPTPVSTKWSARRYAPAAEVANGYRRAMAACLSGRGYSVN